MDRQSDNQEAFRVRMQKTLSRDTASIILDAGFTPSEYITECSVVWLNWFLFFMETLLRGRKEHVNIARNRHRDITSKNEANKEKSCCMTEI
jgi:hypothetical protein